MILPSKHIRIDRSLIGIGAVVLNTLVKPMTVSALWDKIRGRESEKGNAATISYAWFVLTLDMLYMIGAIELEDGLLRKVKK